jgi:hypothetical protein
MDITILMATLLTGILVELCIISHHLGKMRKGE